jgi:TolB protein
MILVISALCIGCGGSPTGGGDEDDPPDNDPPAEDTTPPSAPGGVAGESGDRQVVLNWDAVSADDLDGYNLYRSEESFSNVSGMDPVNGSSLITSEEFTDDDVSNGTTYYYRLTAVDDSENESSTSSEVEVTPFSDPPDRPKN